MIEFRLEMNTDRAVNDVKDAIAKIRADLPRTIDEPIIQRIDVEGQSILTYRRVLGRHDARAAVLACRRCRRARIAGRSRASAASTAMAASIARSAISLDPDRLLALGITAGEVNRQIRATNVDLAGGRGEVGGQEQAIRTLAGARTVAELAETKIIAVRRPRGPPQGTRPRRGCRTPSRAPSAGSTSSPVVSFAVFRSKGSSELVGQGGRRQPASPS